MAAADMAKKSRLCNLAPPKPRKGAIELSHEFPFTRRTRGRMQKAFDNLFDNYTVIVSAIGYQGTAWKPVNVSTAKPANLDLRLSPEGAHLNFRKASSPKPLLRRLNFGDL